MAPSSQEKVHSELVSVTGGGRDVTWEERKVLPYTMAVIREIQRFADIAPTGLIHKTLVDTELAGGEWIDQGHEGTLRLWTLVPQ